MDLETAYKWNHFFGNQLWGIVAAILFVSFVSIFVFRNKRIIRKIMLTVAIVSGVIYGAACVMCFYTYVTLACQCVENEFPGEHDISVEIIDNDTLRFTNNESEPYTINDCFKIEKAIGGNWFYIADDRYSDSFSEEYELQPGESMELTYDTSSYEELDPGHYRFVCCVENHWRFYYVEFDIDANGDYVW